MIDLISILIPCILIFALFIIYYNKGNVWISDDINKIYIQQKVNRKKLKAEIKYLEEIDVYNSFVIYADLEIELPENKDIQEVIDQNRKTDRPIEIVWNDYTRSYHIRYKDHYRKVINKSK